jgi:two-component system cell cycle sensor histidine kinase/response regulator CckA
MPKILVVEDDPIVQELCRAILSREGFEPIITCDGVEGLDTYVEMRDEIALILSDIVMPRMDGIEMVRRILSIHTGASVIIMSGTPLPKFAPEDGIRICGVLRKPFTHGQLVETVNKCLNPSDELISSGD